MNSRIFELFEKNSQIIVYGMCSVFTFMLETVIGYILKNVVYINLIVANSISTLIGAIAHYYLISKRAFCKKMSMWNLAVYIVTFALGFLLQNIVITLFYNVIFSSFSEGSRYVGSKVFSVIIPFFALFFVRKCLYGISFDEKKKSGD